jgi:hypothetical protein
MARPREETNIANRTIAAMRASETVLLDVGDALHDQANRVQDNASNVSSGAERWLGKLCDFWRIENRDWQAARPNPEHLENPKAEERPELVLHRVSWLCMRWRLLLTRLSSKRSSFPVFRMRNSKKPDRRADHTMMKTEATMLRASPLFSLNARVSMANRTKLVPPAKSVSLSNFSVNAMEKKNSW